MAIERTLAIIKPDGVAQKVSGEVIRRIEGNSFRILGLRMVHMSPAQAEGFYAVHRERPFFKSLTAFMSEGPVVVLALEGDNAIARWREMMGPTDSTKAPKGTLRGDYGASIERNVVHGSDSAESASYELKYFFNALELCG